MDFNFEQIMQEAKKMQESIQKAQEDLAKLVITGEAGGGLCKMKMSGTHEVLEITLNDNLLDDKEMLEDILKATFNDCVRRVSEASKKQISALTSGLKLPPEMGGQ